MATGAHGPVLFDEIGACAELTGVGVCLLNLVLDVGAFEVWALSKITVGLVLSCVLLVFWGGVFECGQIGGNISRADLEFAWKLFGDALDALKALLQLCLLALPVEDLVNPVDQLICGDLIVGRIDTDVVVEADQL